MRPTPVTVLVVDDHQVVRDGIKALLAGADDLVVVGEAATAREAVAQATRLGPGVVVMDVRLPDGSGITATRDILAALPATGVVVLTAFADDQALLASVLAGARGYVLKQVRSNELVSAIRAVARGASLLDPRAVEQARSRLRHHKRLLGDEHLAELTPHEERTLEGIARGWTNRQIAAALGLREKTVKNYVSSVLAKLDVDGRAAAAVYLIRHAQP